MQRQKDRKDGSPEWGETLLFTRIAPPCPRTISELIQSPSPVRVSPLVLTKGRRRRAHPGSLSSGIAGAGCAMPPELC